MNIRHSATQTILTLDISIRIVPPESIIGRVEFVPRTWSIHLEIFIMIVRLILMSVHTHLVAVSSEGNGGIQSHLAILLMIDGANFESILVSANETRLLTSIAGGARAHYGSLCKDAGTAVGVGTVLGINGRELCAAPTKEENNNSRL